MQKHGLKAVTRSTYAFFARKVVLVEGDSDRYFFRSVFQHLKPELTQEIAILDIGGKGNWEKWKTFFSEFGLESYYIGDFDNVFTLVNSGATSPIIPAIQKSSTEDTLRQSNFDKMDIAQKGILKRHYEALIADDNFLTIPQFLRWRPLVEHVRSHYKLDSKDVVRVIKAAVPTIQNQIEALYADNIFILKSGKLEDYMGTQSKALDETIKFCLGMEAWLNIASAYTTEIKDIAERISK